MCQNLAKNGFSAYFWSISGRNLQENGLETAFLAVIWAFSALLWPYGPRDDGTRPTACGIYPALRAYRWWYTAKVAPRPVGMALRAYVWVTCW